MKIAILGSRGVPNRYGGFEEMAAHVGPILASMGHHITIYSTSDHPIKLKSYKDCEVVHIFNPEKRLGLAAQFLYDLGCILHARRQHYDIYLQLGYTTSGIWSFLWPKDKTITNMDGLEHQRAKYAGVLSKFLRWSEKRTVKRSKLLVADNPGILEYLEQKYPQSDVTYIPYGTEVPKEFDIELVKKYLSERGLEPYGYDLHIGRVQPDNHVAEILQAAKNAKRHLISIADYSTAWGKILAKEFGDEPNIHLVGTMYDKPLLHALRHYCRYYIHGHSVGGTNPALLEAMGAGCCVMAHNNPFNRSVLEDWGLFWKTTAELTFLMTRRIDMSDRKKATEMVHRRATEIFQWPDIAEQYDALFQRLERQS